MLFIYGAALGILVTIACNIMASIWDAIVDYQTRRQHAALVERLRSAARQVE